MGVVLIIALFLLGAMRNTGHFRRKRRGEPIDEEAKAIMMGYVIVTWGFCVFFILALLR